MARVTDLDGNPVSGVTLYAIPEAATVATLADLLYRSDVDRGTAGIATAPPGKYRVFATAAPVEDTYEWMHRLWDLRSRAKDVVIGPGARVEAQIEAIE